MQIKNMNRIEYNDDMYNPLRVEMRSYISQLQERTKKLTPERARELLMGSGLIDEKSEPTKPYQPGASDQWIMHKIKG